MWFSICCSLSICAILCTDIKIQPKQYIATKENCRTHYNFVIIRILVCLQVILLCFPELLKLAANWINALCQLFFVNEALCKNIQ